MPHRRTSARKYISFATAISWWVTCPRSPKNLAFFLSLFFVSLSFFIQSDNFPLTLSLFFSSHGRREIWNFSRSHERPVKRWLSFAAAPIFLPRLHQRLDQTFSYRYRGPFNSGRTCRATRLSRIFYRASFRSHLLSSHWAVIRRLPYELRIDKIRLVISSRKNRT